MNRRGASAPEEEEIRCGLVGVGGGFWLGCLFSGVLGVLTRGEVRPVWRNIDWRIVARQSRFRIRFPHWPASRQTDKCICPERKMRRCRSGCRRSCTRPAESENHLASSRFVRGATAAREVALRRFYLAAFRPAKPRRRWCKQIRCVVVSSRDILALLATI